MSRPRGHSVKGDVGNTHDVVDDGPVGEGAVAAVVAQDEQGPEHGALKIVRVKICQSH